MNPVLSAVALSCLLAAVPLYAEMPVEGAEARPPENVPVQTKSEVACRQGESLLHLREFDKAVAQFEEAVALDPANAAAHCRWGDALVLLGKPEEALGHYETAIALKPDADEAYANRGEALMKLQRNGEAIVSLRKAVAINPRSVKAHYNLANLLMNGKQYEEAAQHYRAAIEAKPSFAAAHSNLGNAMAALGRRDEAVKAFEAALQINPEHAPAMNNLAWILATSSDDALRDGAKAVRLAEDLCAATYRADPIYLVTLAGAYGEAGRFDDAVQAAREARALAKDRPEFAAEIGDTILVLQSHQPIRTP